jgi:hypothetical protein
MNRLFLTAAAGLALAACDAVSPNRPPSMATLKQEIATWSPAQKTLEAERVTSAFFALTPAERANYLVKSDSGVIMRDYDDTILGEQRTRVASSYGALIAPKVMAYQFNLADGRSFGGVMQARKDTTGQPDLNIRKDDRTGEIRSCEDWVSQRVLEQLTVLRMTGNSDAASVKKNLPADDCSLWSAAAALPKAQEQAAPPPAQPATREPASVEAPPQPAPAAAPTVSFWSHKDHEAPDPTLPVPLSSKDRDIARAMVKATSGLFAPTPDPTLPVPLSSKDRDIARAMVKATSGLFAPHE